MNPCKKELIKSNNDTQWVEASLGVPATSNRLVILERQECVFIKVIDICYVQANGSYSTIYFTNGKSRVVSKNVKTFVNRLPYPMFYQVHRSYLININCISKYVKSEGGFMIMEDGKHIPVSQAKRPNIQEWVNTMAI